MRRETFMETLPCKLDEEEVGSRGEELARTCRELGVHQEAMKDTASKMKAEEKRLDVRITKLADAVATRQEERLVECYESPNLGTLSIETIRMDTHDVASRRPMDEKEREKARQGELDFSPSVRRAYEYDRARERNDAASLAAAREAEARARGQEQRTDAAIGAYERAYGKPSTVTISTPGGKEVVFDKAAGDRLREHIPMTGGATAPVTFSGPIPEVGTVDNPVPPIAAPGVGNPDELPPRPPLRAGELEPEPEPEADPKRGTPDNPVNPDKIH